MYRLEEEEEEAGLYLQEERAGLDLAMSLSFDSQSDLLRRDSFPTASSNPKHLIVFRWGNYAGTVAMREKAILLKHTKIAS